MRIFAISDLHLSNACDKPMDIFGGAWCDYWDKIVEDWESKVKDEDVVLISGDISWGMKLSDAVPDIAEIGNLKGRKVILRGNHDYWWSSYSRVMQSLPNGMFALQNNAVKIDDLVICGSRGWNLPDGSEEEQDRLIYQREIIRLRLSLENAASIKEEGNRLVGMVHFPPFLPTFADSEITALFAEYGVTAVVYGHLHGNSCRKNFCVEKGSTKYFLTSCDLLNNKLLDITDFIG